MSEDTLIINHIGFHQPLRQAIEKKGLNIVEQAWEPDAVTLKRSIACVVWFYDALRYPVKIWRLKQRLKSFGVPLVAWNRDAPHYLNRSAWRLNILDRVRLFDIYATHSLADERRDFAGLKLYLPNAADVSNYRLTGVVDSSLRNLRDPSRYHYDVSFFGAMDGGRHKEMYKREIFFRELAERLTSHGVTYLFCESSGMTVDEQIKLIQTSRINLNFGASCEYRAPFASGLPERCYGIPATGGFLLCDRRTHARNDFSVGNNWAEFDGLEDCVTKIQYWLANFQEARALAEKCYFHVMTHHTYEKRADKLLSSIQAWHKGYRGLIL